MANVNDVERVLNRKDQGQQPKWTEVNPEVGTEEVFDFFVDRFPFFFFVLASHSFLLLWRMLI